MQQPNKQTAVITVVGHDQVGIIAAVATLLADAQVNINDISQTILQDIFTMIMLVDVSAMTIGLTELGCRLDQIGGNLGISIRVQHSDVFDAMHRI
ncbi:MAG: ACT domain-containing protein [Clostridiaceae bacterium]|nr:ACT domain-containing protein [Clostridiaceae bacterium]